MEILRNKLVRNYLNKLKEEELKKQNITCGSCDWWQCIRHETEPIERDVHFCTEKRKEIDLNDNACYKYH